MDCHKKASIAAMALVEGEQDIGLKQLSDCKLWAGRKTRQTSPEVSGDYRLNLVAQKQRIRE